MILVSVQVLTIISLLYLQYFRNIVPFLQQGNRAFHSLLRRGRNALMMNKRKHILEFVAGLPAGSLKRCQLSSDYRRRKLTVVHIATTSLFSPPLRRD
jgi:hypothetical protein